MGYVGNVYTDGTTHLVGSTLYGTCSTGATTAAKVVSCPNFDTLLPGVTIHVKFTYTNNVDQPTLNVNNTGAKSISPGGYWNAGAVISFTYDGTNWAQNDFDNYNVNPNILDNWYFIGEGSQQNWAKGGLFPINTRGSTSYTNSATNGSYCIDRWRLYNSQTTLAIAGDGLSVSNTGNSGQGYWIIRQWIDGPKNYAGKVLTVSAIFSSVSGITGIGVLASTSSGDTDAVIFNNYNITSDGIYSVTGIVPNNPTSLSVVIRTNGTASFKVRAIKLEVGNKQTLAHRYNGDWILNETPNYYEQFYRCRMSHADMEDNWARRARDLLFFEIEELGLTSGSATIIDAWDAMPTNSSAFLNSNSFVSGQVPSWGLVYIIKRTSSGFVLLFGDGSNSTYNNPLYRMTIDPSTGKPTGTWVAINDYCYSRSYNRILTSTSLTRDLMFGRTMILGGNAQTADLVVTIPTAELAAMPEGAEFAFFMDSPPAYTVTLKFMGIAVCNPDLGWRTADSTNGRKFTITKRYSMVTGKKIFDSTVALYGEFEEVTS